MSFGFIIGIYKKIRYTKVPLIKLKDQWRSLAFLAAKETAPIFDNNLVDVTKDAADKIALLYKCLIKRGIEEEIARRFTLQCLVAIFADHTGLFPESGFFTDIVNECINDQKRELPSIRITFPANELQNTRRKGIDLRTYRILMEASLVK